MAIQTQGTRLLRVGIDDAPPVPMQMGDPALNTSRGYQVDLLHLLAEQLNATIEYRRAMWSLIMQEVSSGCINLICSAATVTEQRKTAPTLVRWSALLDD